MNAPPRQHLLTSAATAARPRPILLISILFAGIVGWVLLFGRTCLVFLTLGPWGLPAMLVFAVIVGSIAAIPPIAASVNRGLNRLRAPSTKQRRWSTLVVAFLTAEYLSRTAIAEHRQMWPYVHDEFSYLIQARQFAAGHLWMPGHPLAGFFDSFQLFAAPVYASAYFPGTALLYVPGIWLHLPAWTTSLAIVGLIGGLLYRITTELIDGLAGWLAVLLLWSDRVFRTLSIMTMGQAPALMFGMLAVWAWLKWNGTRGWRWAFGIGVFTGLAAITRPLDAICFAMPIGIAMLRDLLRRDTGLRAVRVSPNFGENAATEIENPPHGPEAGVTLKVFSPLIYVIAGAAPLLMLQLTLNHGITGHLFETPFRLYADRDYPGTAYGFHPFDPAAKPASDLPQKLALYRDYRETLKLHQPWPAVLATLRFRLPLTLTQGTPAPFPLLLPLLLAALIGLTRRRAVLLVSLPMFLLLYAGYVFFFPHYVLTAAAAVIVGILAGAGQIPLAFPKYRRFHTIFWTLFIAGLAVAALPQWDASTNDDQFTAPLMANVDRQLANLPRRPAIVLFTYDPKRTTNEEPVYNADAGWPDDSLVIRAHDRGPLNVELFRYYAEHQPGRFVYRYDERTRQLSEMGSVTELARSHSAGTNWP